MPLHRVSWPMVVLLQSQAPTDSSTGGLVWASGHPEHFLGCVCVQDLANLLGHTGLWGKEEESRSAPPALCLQKVVASQPTF